MIARTDYEAVSPAGVTVFTTSDLAIAKAYVRENADRLPGLRVEIVETTVTRRRTYAPRSLLRVA